MPASLVQTLRHRYLESITSVQPASGWKLLVLDQETQMRINGFLKMYDILEQGVQQVELISNQRNAFPRLEAVYILTPTSENVSRLIRDYEPPRPAQAATKKSPAVPASSGPKYAAAHVFFINSLHDKDVERLVDSPAGPYLKTLKEIYVDFTPLEAQIFSVQFPESFWTLYSPTAFKFKDAMQSWEATLDEMAGSLVNVCATLNESPDIRYYAPEALGRPPLGPNSKQHLNYVLAKMVDHKLKAYSRDNPDFQALTESKPKSTLLITDRSMDLLAPFLHEFTYQAMCNDLLEIEEGSKYHHTFRNEQGKLEETEVTLNEDDKVWCDVRHMHMKDALDTLVAAFKQFNAEHGGPSGSSLNDLKDMLASLPGMKESKEKLSLHLSLAEQCMGMFETRKLPLTASVEQSCATGMTPEGKTPKTLVEEMVPLLDDRSVSREDKVRIIALYVMHRDGVPEEDRKRLYQHARLGMTEVDAVNNLVHLGQEVSKESRSKRKPVFKQVCRDDTYDISRYQPALQLMLEEQAQGRLDRAVFPHVNPPPGAAAGGSLRSGGSASPAPGAAPTSLRSARPRWTAGAKSKASNEPRQRLMVFVAGGMTYSEIRCAYQVSSANNKDVYLGSTHVITPEAFIEELATIERPTASKARSRPQNPPPISHARTMSSTGPAQAPPAPSGHSSRPSNGLPGRPGPSHSQTTRPTASSLQGAYRGPPPSSTSSAPPAHSYNSSVSSVSHDDFVPQINKQPSRPPSSNTLPSSTQLTPKPSASSIGSTASTGGAGEKPKKKGLFGRLK